VSCLLSLLVLLRAPSRLSETGGSPDASGAQPSTRFMQEKLRAGEPAKTVQPCPYTRSCNDMSWFCACCTRFEQLPPPLPSQMHLVTRNSPPCSLMFIRIQIFRHRVSKNGSRHSRKHSRHGPQWPGLIELGSSIPGRI
jgi:hypothetical protein